MRNKRNPRNFEGGMFAGVRWTVLHVSELDYLGRWCTTIHEIYIEDLQPACVLLQVGKTPSEE